MPVPPTPTPPTPGAGSRDWNGSFVGDGGQLAMHVQGQNGQYTGHFEAGGQSYPFQAQGTAERIEGAFQSNGSPFTFVAERAEGGYVWLRVGDTDYLLEPAQPGGNPFGRP
jgi:hypothetical protein